MITGLSGETALVQELAAEHAVRQRDRHRSLVSQAMRHQISKLIVAKGQCAIHLDDLDFTRSEARDNREFMSEHPNTHISQRLNMWKPRTPRKNPPKPWEGTETTHAELALRITQNSAEDGNSNCTEIGLPRHKIYIPHLTFGWIGARNRDEAFVLNIAMEDPSLPLFVKNDLTGDTEWAHNIIKTARHIRSQMSQNAFVGLIHRGGSDLNTPQKWEDHLLRELERTSGEMIVEFAHGAEQAHDPDGNFEKSADGEERAMDHYIAIGQRTGMWAVGVAAEASNAPRRVDPHMSQERFFEGVAHIADQMHPLAQPPLQIFDSEFPDHMY